MLTPVQSSLLSSLLSRLLLTQISLRASTILFNSFVNSANLNLSLLLDFTLGDVVRIDKSALETRRGGIYTV